MHQFIAFQYIRSSRPLKSLLAYNRIPLQYQNTRYFNTNQNSQSNHKKPPPLLDFDPQIDYYSKLEISVGASETDIKKAFYKLAKKYHPDSSESKSTIFEQEKFKEISVAYDVLSDKQKKAQYDQLRQEIKYAQYNQYQKPQGSSSEWTYRYNNNDFSKRSQSSSSNYQYRQQYSYQDNQQQEQDKWQGWSYQKAKEQYERSYRDQTNAKYQYQNKYNYYEKQQQEEFERFKQELRKQKEKEKARQEKQKHPYSNDNPMQALLYSFIGFCGVTYFVFGASLQREQPPKVANAGSGNNSGQGRVNYGSSSERPVLQKWTNTNLPDSNYYQPSTFHGRVHNKKYDPLTTVDVAYNYYKEFEGVVEMPKMEVKNSMTPVQDQITEEEFKKQMQRKKALEERKKKQASNNSQVKEGQKKVDQKMIKGKSQSQSRQRGTKEQLKPKEDQVLIQEIPIVVIKTNQTHLKRHQYEMPSRKMNTY